jgi:hypothetical protein
MAAELHPAASHHLPSFITPPGEADILMVITAVFLVVAILTFGILFFRLHHLPEHMARGSKKVQLEICRCWGLLPCLPTYTHSGLRH